MLYRAPMLLIGVGNVLRRDDGVGVHVIRLIASRPLPADLEVYDAGSVGLDVADVLEDRERVVIVDAVDAGALPGEVCRFLPEQLQPALRTGLSVHDLHLLDALEQTRLLGHAPRRVIVLGVQVADVSPGLDLSPAVKQGLDRIARRALVELGLGLCRADGMEHACLVEPRRTSGRLGPHFTPLRAREVASWNYRAANSSELVFRPSPWWASRCGSHRVSKSSATVRKASGSRKSR